MVTTVSLALVCDYLLLLSVFLFATKLMRPALMFTAMSISDIYCLHVP